jgi:hypothetical protein
LSSSALLSILSPMLTGNLLLRRRRCCPAGYPSPRRGKQTKREKVEGEEVS